MSKMILRMPDYCRDFRCSAGSCSDNCCIGWEIDIDSRTADYYKSVGGSFGERLRSSISWGKADSFILKNERCPFLNNDNLCDIILNLGEDKICHICTEHPRYYEWFDGVKEGGVGLCCEEAARLILEKGGSPDYYEQEIPYEECGEYDCGLYDFLSSAREKILRRLRDNSIPLSRCAFEIERYTCELQELVDNYSYDSIPEINTLSEPEKTVSDTEGILEIFSRLEPIDEKWQPFIFSIREKSADYHYSGKYDRYLRNIGIYFIRRYFMKGVFDEEILSKTRLAIISMAMLSLIFECCDADSEQCIILAKNYSKEVEYSEENLEAIYDMCYTEKIFSADELIKFLAL